MKIKLTKEDVINSYPQERLEYQAGCDCVLGQALQREGLNTDKFWVQGTWLSVNKEQYWLTPEAKEIARKHDILRANVLATVEDYLQVFEPWIDKEIELVKEPM